jgi:phosphoribosyl-AMP cyclohydrolase
MFFVEKSKSTSSLCHVILLQKAGKHIARTHFFFWKKQTVSHKSDTTHFWYFQVKDEHVWKKRDTSRNGAFIRKPDSGKKVG